MVKIIERMKTLRLALCAALLLGISLTATAQQTLNIHTTTQGVVSIAFAEKPDLTFPAKEVLTVTTESMTVEFPFAEVEKITFEDGNEDGVETLSVRDGSGAIVHVYDLSGKLVRQGIAATHGSASVNLSTLRPGVYVVRDGKRTYKVTKR